MLRVGLTGGIGSGKSTVAARWVQRGAVLIDSDVMARAVVAPGTPGLAAVRQRFGAEVMTSGGELDRARLADLVFADERARADLNAIVHPLVGEETERQLASLEPDVVVVHDIPLLVELDRGVQFHLVVVIDADARTRQQRLVRDRGMSPEQARARIAAQATDDQRRAAADLLLSNQGSKAEVDQAADQAWEQRVFPFQENLMADRRLHSTAESDPGGAESEADLRAQRVLRRLRHHLGDSSLPEPATALREAAHSGPDLLIRAELRDLSHADSADFRAAARAAGFVHARPVTVDEPGSASADALSPAGAVTGPDSAPAVEFLSADPQVAAVLRVAAAH